MKPAKFGQALLLAGLSGLMAAAAPAPDPTVVPLDSEATVNGVGVGCTGVGQTKLDPRWAAYPVRIEFSDAENAYLADETITVWNASGDPILTVSCEGPWILLKLPPGAYRVEGRIRNPAVQPRTATFRPPSRGQMRLVLKFPDA
jgi:hypothetical protein